MQERGRVMVVDTQVVDRPAKPERPQPTPSQRAGDKLETAYVGLLVAAAAAVLALFRRRGF